MHIIEQYALSSGCKISQPYLNPQFYPIPFEKYIVLHASSGMESKNYDLYNEVIELILPYLQKENINIIQIGGEKDKKIKNCYYVLGTTKLQMQYIIQNSLLVLANDTCSIHFASGLNKKIVTLYTTLYPSNASPYWSKPEDVVLLESDRNGNKPSYSAQEYPKTINLIKPELVAKSVLKLLNISELINIETLYIGKEYYNPIVEIVPNFFNPNIKNQNIFIRLDYINNNEKLYIHDWARQNNLIIVTDKFLNLNILNQLKEKIKLINFEIKDEYDINKYTEFFKFIQKIGINLKLYSKNAEKISRIRFDFFDFAVDLLENKQNPLDKNFNLDKLHIKSNKFLFSNGKIYFSKAHLLQNLPIEECDSPLDNQDFWNEIENFYIYDTK
jgi:hypothetical protein